MENKNTEGTQVYNKIGLRIKDARISKKITQDDLGFNVGVSGQYISLIELGKANIGSIDLLVKLMNNLDLSPNELFCDYVKGADVILKNEYAEILEDCTFEQIQAINKITKVLKEELKEYIPNDNNK